MFKKKKQPRETRPSQPASVFSYYSSRSDGNVSRGRYQQPTAKERHGMERIGHLASILALVAVIVSLFYASLLDTRPRLNIAATTSGKPLQRPSNVYAEYFSEQVNGSVLNRSKLTFNSRAVTDAMKQQFPEIADAVVTLPLLGHQPVLRIAVSSPAFSLVSSNGAYYMNHHGVALVKVSEVQQQLPNISSVVDQSNAPVTVGQQVLPTQTVSFISGVIEQLRATNTPVQSLTLPAVANELVLQVSGLPYVVRLNTLEDPRVQVGVFLATKAKLEGSGEVPKEYIDARVADRAYYR